MTEPQISNELAGWARLTGHTVSRDSISEAALIASPGGEVRYYIRTEPSGGFTLTSAERASAEQFELYTTSMETMERYLMGLFGYLYRSTNRLPRLKPLRFLHDLAPAYTVVPKAPEGYWELIDQSLSDGPLWLRLPIEAPLAKIDAIERSE